MASLLSFIYRRHVSGKKYPGYIHTSRAHLGWIRAEIETDMRSVRALFLGIDPMKAAYRTPIVGSLLSRA